MLLGPRVGLDFSGVVKQVGTGVTELAVGDEVFGTAAGSLAEFVTVDAGRIARKPSSLSFAQAAAMPTAYLTGLQSLRAGGVNGDSKVLTDPNPNPNPTRTRTRTRTLTRTLTPTQTRTLPLPPTKVLVIGASGGCGSAGVQIAKALGAREIVGVASGKNAEMVRAQGADRVVDYQTQRLEDEPADYDVVYDTATNSGAREDYNQRDG